MREANLPPHAHLLTATSGRCSTGMHQKCPPPTHRHKSQCTIPFILARLSSPASPTCVPRARTRRGDRNRDDAAANSGGQLRRATPSVNSAGQLCSSTGSLRPDTRGNADATAGDHRLVFCHALSFGPAMSLQALRPEHWAEAKCRRTPSEESPTWRPDANI